jgi:hypothetical protein
LRRIFVRGSNIGIRTFAVIVLALGLAGGLFAGTHTKKADTLTTISAANAAEIDARVEADRLDTQQLQEAKSESFQKQRTQEYLAGVAQAKLVAARKANALAKAKAEASRKAAEATAARKEAASRVSRSSDRVTASEETSGGTAPPAPVDCQNYSGNKQVGCSLLAWGGFSTS